MNAESKTLSEALLKELHLLTPNGRLNSDAARKIKQVKHLIQFIEPALEKVFEKEKDPVIVDFGSGKSYLGFFIYDLFFKNWSKGKIISVESREDLVANAKKLAAKAGFKRMEFLHASIEDSSKLLPERIDILTALHACDTATDDVISVAIRKQAPWLFYVPCCQAELARKLDTHESPELSTLFRHPHHRREFGSHLTNVMRGLFVESQGYKVRVSELVGWEHSMKNEIWICEKHQKTNSKAKNDLDKLIEKFAVFPGNLENIR